MQARAPDMRLADTQNLTDGELYWIIENGQQMEGMNPRNPLELQEELDDRRFLAGEDVDTASSGVHHQEAP